MTVGNYDLSKDESDLLFHLHDSRNEWQKQFNDK